MIIYLIKVSACVTLVYAVYLVFFRQTNKLQLNRGYLLAGLLFSFVVPFIVVQARPIGMTPAIIKGSIVMDNVRSVGITGPTAINHSFVYYIYYFGAAISVGLVLVSVLKPLKLYFTANRLKYNRQTIIVHPGIRPFSFLGVLFIRSGNEEPMIIEHEMVHITQRHWIDLVVVEVASIVLWFNPVIHYYRRSVAIQHEYIADRHVTLNTPIKAYLDCIAKELASGIHSRLVNSFNTQSIKQRIIMITNTKKYSSVRYTIVLPLVAVLVMAFATQRVADANVSQNRELRSPVDVAKLKPGEGAGFGMRFNAKTNKEALHTGVDFVLAAGSSVYAASGGVVVSAERSGDYGNLVVIEHANELRTLSAHLERILVKKGDKVDAGQVIGTVGSTGLSTGPHLHFEVLKDGKAVDPVPYLNMSLE